MTTYTTESTEFKAITEKYSSDDMAVLMPYFEELEKYCVLNDDTIKALGENIAHIEVLTGVFCTYMTQNNVYTVQYIGNDTQLIQIILNHIDKATALANGFKKLMWHNVLNDDTISALDANIAHIDTLTEVFCTRMVYDGVPVTFQDIGNDPRLIPVILRHIDEAEALVNGFKKLMRHKVLNELTIKALDENIKHIDVLTRVFCTYMFNGAGFTGRGQYIGRMPQLIQIILKHIDKAEALANSFQKLRSHKMLNGLTIKALDANIAHIEVLTEVFCTRMVYSGGPVTFRDIGNDPQLIPVILRHIDKAEALADCFKKLWSRNVLNDDTISALDANIAHIEVLTEVFCTRMGYHGGPVIFLDIGNDPRLIPVILRHIDKAEALADCFKKLMRYNVLNQDTITALDENIENLTSFIKCLEKASVMRDALSYITRTFLRLKSKTEINAARQSEHQGAADNIEKSKNDESEGSASRRGRVTYCYKSVTKGRHEKQKTDEHPADEIIGNLRVFNSCSI